MSFQPKFTVTAHLLEIIEEISAYRQKIQSATIQVPWIPQLQRDSRARTSHASTAIEGNPLTLEEVRKLEEGKPLPTSSERARREILNQLAGLRFVEKSARKKIIAHNDIFKLHRLIASDVMDQGVAGQYRKINVRVGHYVAPPYAKVKPLMSDLLVWWNTMSAEWSPVISSAIIHYQFEAIHPFGDGNGRTGRALALWELYRRGFDSHHIFSVDEAYWENRPRYYAGLDGVRHASDDLTSWLEYTAEALHLALERVWVRIQKLQITYSGAQALTLRPKQERVLNLLRDHGAMTPRALWAALKVTKQGAMGLLNPLLDAGLIERVGGKKLGKYQLKRM